MKTRKREIGDLGEDIAALFLEKKGFKILERNYLRPWGEIDIIAEKSGTVRFVEVKTVSRESPAAAEKGSHRPEEQVHPKKLEKIARTAELYMNNKKGEQDFQVDVVAVFLNHRSRTATCRLYEQVL